MTNGATRWGGGAPSGAPRPGSCEYVAVRALAAFAFEQRVEGAKQAAAAHETFDGILTEHAAALDEIRGLLREEAEQLTSSGLVVSLLAEALGRLDQEIDYVHALAAAGTEEAQDAK